MSRHPTPPIHPRRTLVHPARIPALARLARLVAARAGAIPLVRSAAGVSLVASLGAATAACSSDFDHEDFVAATCANGEWLPFANLQPAEMRDHLAAIGSGGDRGPYVVAEMGTRCDGASDPTQCESDFMAAWSASFARGFVSTDGGSVESWLGAPSMARFLGEIDTLDESILLTWSDGYDVRCGSVARSAARPLASGGYMVIGTRMTMSCDPIEHTRYLLQVGGDGSIRERDREVYDSESGACVGRRPVGLVAARHHASRDPLGAYLANAAHLEASAVIAFDDLHRELSALSAPRSLLDAIREARADEVRHARVMSRLALRRGARPHAPCVVARRASRSAFEVAIENAVEGCVRETFGAMVGLHQAEHAADPEIREAMIGIAADEIRHADLSWAMHDWLAERVDEGERAQVESARGSAMRELVNGAV